MSPWWRATEQKKSQDTRKTNKVKQPAPSSPSRWLQARKGTKHCTWKMEQTQNPTMGATINNESTATEVSKGTKTRNRYNQVPHVTQDNNGKVTNSQLDTINESQEVSPFPFVVSCWERLTSCLSFVRSNYDVVTSWVRCGVWLCRFLIYTLFRTLICTVAE